MFTPNKKHTPAFKARSIELLSFAALCVIGSFMIGIHTAGDVQTFDHMEAEAIDVPDSGPLIQSVTPATWNQITFMWMILQGYREKTSGVDASMNFTFSDPVSVVRTSFSFVSHD